MKTKFIKNRQTHLNKKLLILLMMFLFQFSTFSQVVCGGTFTDNGGATNNYLPNSFETVVICSPLSWEMVTVTFNYFDTETEKDGFYVYDGTTANPATLIASPNGAGSGVLNEPGAFWGSTIPGPFTANNPTSCLTFVFKSDSAIQNGGFSADISCGPWASFTLNAFLDINNNGIKENTEPILDIGHFTSEKNNSGIINNINSTYGENIIYDNNSSNNYNFGFVIDPIYSPYYNNITPVLNNIVTNSSFMNVNFPITVANNFSDLSVNMTATQAPKAGYIYHNKIKFSNQGNQIVTSGLLTFNKDNALMGSVITASIGGVNQNINLNSIGFTYDFNNLDLFETRILDVYINIPSIPAVSTFQILTNTVNISSINTDPILSNNNFSISQPVVFSYDPNDITESHGEKILFNNFNFNDYLYYTIRFENTGTANADDVLITNFLDSKIDETSIEVIASSHNYFFNRQYRNLRFKFDNINLPVSIDNSLVGKGFITYKAKLKSGFGVGTIIQNQAKIYFDSNPAILTNVFNTEFVSNLGSKTFSISNCKIFPNPAKENFTIFYDGLTVNSTISLVDLTGRGVANFHNETITGTIDVNITTYSAGIYLLVVKENDVIVWQQKLIIEK